VQAFVSSNEVISFTLTDRVAAYGWTLCMAQSGATTRKLCDRVFKVHGDVRFGRLAGISNEHLYNPREQKTYQAKRGCFDKIRPSLVNIGERHKPALDGCPGYLCPIGYIPRYFANQVNTFTVPVTFQLNTRIRKAKMLRLFPKNVLP